MHSRYCAYIVVIASGLDPLLIGTETKRLNSAIGSCFQFVIRCSSALIVCIAVTAACGQASSDQSSNSQYGTSPALDQIFEPTDLNPAADVVQRWTSNGLAEQLESRTVLRNLEPLRDSFTSPSNNPQTILQNLQTENSADRVARLPQTSDRGMLEPIAEPAVELEPPIQDYQIETISFQETVEEPETQKPPIELVNETPQDENPQATTPGTPAETSLIPDELPLEKLASQIKEQIERISKEQGDETLKDEQLQQLNTANAKIQEANNFQSKINAQKNLEASFEARLKELQEKLKTPTKSATPDPSTSSEELQLELQDKRQELQTKKTRLGENQRKAEFRDKRINQLPADRTAAEEKLKRSQQDLSLLDKQTEGASNQLSQLFLKAQEWAAKKEIEALDIEEPRQEESGKLLPLERSWLSQEIARLESDIQTLNTAYNEARKMEIDDQKSAQANLLNKQATMQDQGLKNWAQRNQSLAEERSKWTNGIKLAQTNSKAVTAKLEEIDTSLNTIRQATENDLTTEVGISLVEQRRSLIMPWENQAQNRSIQTKLNEIRLKKLGWQEDRQKISSVDTAVDQLLPQNKLETLAIRLVESKFGPAGSLGERAFRNLVAEEMQRLKSLTRDLVESRIKLLDDLNEDYEVYNKELIDEKNERLELIKKITEMRKLIDEKALWIQSANALWEDSTIRDNDLIKSFEGFASFSSPSKWESFAGNTAERLMRRPYESALAGLILFSLFVVSHRMREKS